MPLLPKRQLSVRWEKGWGVNALQNIMHKPKRYFILRKCYDNWQWCKFTRALCNEVLLQLLYHYITNGGFHDALQDSRPNQEKGSTVHWRFTSPQYSVTVNYSLFIFHLLDSHLSSNDANKTDYSIILNHHWEICYNV